MYDGDTFKLDGATFTVSIERDKDAFAPWKNSDGHGVVGRWDRRSTDAPRGHWVLASDRGSWRLYNWYETMQIAKRDGWGLCDKAMAGLAKRLGRTPTARDIRKQAVYDDFDFLYGWCNDVWQYVVIGVTIEGGETEYLGGVESNSHDYMKQVAHDLARELLYMYGVEKDRAVMEVGG